MKLLFLHPADPLPDGGINKNRFPLLPHLTLPYLAALTPPHVKVKLIEEALDDIDFKERFDLVAISANIVQMPRAYFLAGEFRKRGAKVVIGGFHASTFPEEAAPYVDSVVVGEAEDLWKTVIEDFENGNLKPLYEMRERPSLTGLPIPRYDLLKLKRYKLPGISMQATRGCPRTCTFCEVTRFYEGTFRMRPVEEVIEEIRILKPKYITFMDDAITANQEYAMRLFEAMIPFKVKWTSQASLDVANRPELVRLMKESGCFSLFIGVESISEQNLADCRKQFNRAKDYERSFRILHQAGIHIIASMMFGFDHDTKNVFLDTVRYLDRNKVSIASLNLLVPFPRTAVWDKLDKEGRILSTDWRQYNSVTCLFKPKNMTPSELEEGLWKAYDAFYSYPSIFRRLFLPLKRNLLLALFLNLNSRRAVKRRVHILLN